MADVWHDINTPGFLGSKKPIQQASAEEDVIFDTSAIKESSGPEVRLSDPQWAEGPDGFAFNKKVGASVKVEYLKQTSRVTLPFSHRKRF